MPKIGQPVRWVPSSFYREQFGGVPLRLSGKIVYINRKHRFYTVEALCNGYLIRESFKF